MQVHCPVQETHQALCPVPPLHTCSNVAAVPSIGPISLSPHHGDEKNRAQRGEIAQFLEAGVDFSIRVLPDARIHTFNPHIVLPLPCG